jgi:RNA polymerase sigma factor (sigma-70 family)
MTPPTPIIHVVDDDASLRTAVTRLLRAAGYEVRSYPSAGEFLLARQANTPGCVLLDVSMPGPSGLDLQEAIGKRDDALPIIFLTGHGDIPMSVRAMKAGAVDFLTKPVRREALLNAVQTALGRDGESRKAREQEGALRARLETLTTRERAVFALVAAGKGNKEIAAELGISERTVKAHRAQVMEKMQVASLAELDNSGVPHPARMLSPVLLSRERVERLTPPRVGQVAMPGELPRIVVVEDDASMSQAMERVLRAGGFAPALFVSAEAALEAGAPEAADCLVLDIHLPGMSGLELYQRLAVAGNARPVIFITARDGSAVRLEAERLGGAGSYLPKPFSGRALLDAITQALRCQ